MLPFFQSSTIKKIFFYFSVILLFTNQVNICSEDTQSNLISAVLSKASDFYTWSNDKVKDNPLAMLFLSTIVTNVIAHKVAAYYEDPVIKALNLEERQRRAALESHPDYITVNVLEKKHQAGERANIIERDRQALVLQELQRRVHVEDKMDHYRNCASSGATPEERNNCEKIYQSYARTYHAYFPAPTNND
jgi:hypothetical protein